MFDESNDLVEFETAELVLNLCDKAQLAPAALNGLLRSSTQASRTTICVLPYLQISDATAHASKPRKSLQKRASEDNNAYYVRAGS